MDRTAVLKEKSKYSSLCVGLPVGSHEYKGWCVLPADEKYFTTDAEVDEYEKAVAKEWLNCGKKGLNGRS